MLSRDERSKHQQTADDLDNPPAFEIAPTTPQAANIDLDAVESTEITLDTSELSHADGAAQPTGPAPFSARLVVLHIAPRDAPPPRSILALTKSSEIEVVRLTSVEAAIEFLASGSPVAIILQPEYNITAKKGKQLLAALQDRFNNGADTPNLVVMIDETAGFEPDQWIDYGFPHVVDVTLESTAVYALLFLSTNRSTPAYSETSGVNSPPTLLLKVRDEAIEWARALLRRLAKQRTFWKSTAQQLRRNSGDSGNLLVSASRRATDWVVGHTPEISHQNAIIILSVVSIAAVAAFVVKEHQHGTTVETVKAAYGGQLIHSTYVGDVVSDKTATILSPVSGMIKKIYVSPGESVSSGQLLVELDSSEAELKLDLLEAQLASLEQSISRGNGTLKTVQAAARRGEASELTADSFAFELKELRSRREVARQELQLARHQLSKMHVHAPFDGRIVDISAVNQSWVDADRKLLVLADPQATSLHLIMPAGDGAFVSEGQPITLRDPLVASTEKSLPIAATQPLDATTTLVTVRLDDVSNDFRFGQSVMATLQPASSGALVLPVSALRTVDDRPMVALSKDDRVVFVPVIVGRQTSQRVEILDGLREGDDVIVSHQPLHSDQHVHPLRVATAMP